MAGGSVNKVILVGNLGKDPELRYTSSGKAVADFSVATSESFGKGTEREEQTEWHRIVVWDKLAELCGEYLSKGRKVYVEGRLQTRKWTDRDGQDRYTTEVIARDVVFLSGRDDRPAAPGGGSPRRQNTGEDRPSFGGGRSGASNAPVPSGGPDFEDDDIPF